MTCTCMTQGWLAWSSLLLMVLCRLCDAVGVGKLEGGVDSKLLKYKLEELEAEVGVDK